MYIIPCVGSQERILLTDDDVPLVPIAMSRRVLRISAEVSDRVLLYVNVTKTPMFLMDGFSLVEMSNCVILWDLSSQTLAQDISADTHAVLNILPIFSMQVCLRLRCKSRCELF